MRLRTVVAVFGWVTGLCGAVTSMIGAVELFALYRETGGMYPLPPSALLLLIAGLTSCIVGHLLLRRRVLVKE